MKEEKKTKNNFACPICNGRGRLFIPRGEITDWAMFRRQAAKTLLENRYSIRQVQKLLGYGSTRTVAIIRNNIKGRNVKINK